MHAEHADSSEVNDLPGAAIDCATIRRQAHAKDILVGGYFANLAIIGVILVCALPSS